MYALLIFISVIIPLTIVSLVIFSIVWWLQNDAGFSRYNKKNRLIFKFDLASRKIASINVLGATITHFKEIESGRWTPISALTENYPNDIQKMFAEVFDKLDRGSESEKVVFNRPSILLKDHIGKFEYVFSRIENKPDCFLTVSWDTLPIEKTKKIFKAHDLSRDQVVEEQARWKGFVAFNINNTGHSFDQRLIEIVEKMYRFHQVQYFHSSGYLIFLHFDNSNKNVKKWINKFVKNFVNAGYEKGWSQLFEGSSYMISSKVTTIKYLNRIIQTLDYLISVSIEQKTNFITLNHISDKDDFEAYVEAAKTFRQAVRSKSIASLPMIIKQYKSNHKMIAYRYPQLEEIDQQLVTRILKNKNNIDAIVDSHADSNIFDQNLKEQSLVDVTTNWLIKNAEKITNKNIVYVVRLENEKNLNEVEEIIIKLAKEGLAFGLKIYGYSSSVATLIQSVKPSYIVVSRTVWNSEGVLDSERMFELMSIRQLAEQNDIKMVYQEPSKIIDQHTANRIGLQYFFDKEFEK